MPCLTRIELGACGVVVATRGMQAVRHRRDADGAQPHAQPHADRHADGVHADAMVAVPAMGIGLFMPPFGVGCYTTCAIGRIAPDKGMKTIVPYMLALVAGLLLVALVPWLSVGFL